ncbi:hypothetical protein [Thiomonas sp.]|uniref:hypothetical protein n=1 Tax=Thiomonas sp. TaxID=2047785 RepID=UPI0025879F85|nr:hypothetical protein [Thiomonas sp.]
MNRDALTARYARIEQARLTDYELICLSIASAVTPSIPGFELYVAHVAEMRSAVPVIAAWATGLADSWARELVLGPTGQRRKPRIASWSWSWGRSAVAHGLVLALWGAGQRDLDPPVQMVSLPTWRKVREFSRTTTEIALEEYQQALEWAHGLRASRLFDQRFEAHARRLRFQKFWRVVEVDQEPREGIGPGTPGSPPIHPLDAARPGTAGGRPFLEPKA